MSRYDPLLMAVKERLDAYRYSHVYGVYKECIRLADIFRLSDKDRDDLLISAIFHDITKAYNTKEQIELAEKLGVSLSPEDIASPKTLHAITASALIAKDFPEYASSAVCSAVRYHTTGRENMCTVEKLLYLADYIEEGRSFPDCVQVREYFYSLIENNTHPDTALERAMLLSFDLTLSQLENEGAYIHPETVISRNYLAKKLEYN